MAARTYLIPLFLLVGLSASGAGFATEPAFFFDVDKQFRECSNAQVRALRIFRVARARLLLADCGELALPLEPPLILEFHYQRDVPAHAFDESARTMLKRNLEPELRDELEGRIATFNEGYRDTREGDVYRLHYSDDGRLVLTFNGEAAAREQGHDFARAYLQIWFGPDPYSGRLKDALLGR